MMRSDAIRKTFLDFFAARGHRVVRSSPLVPANDPTLLFANAGMNQFKDVFLGREKRDYSRACSSQKCVRAGGKHNDLEQVGRTTRHHTFFEMLGNFSFGDYFKKDAIAWAWELITQGYAIPIKKLYVTIFAGATEPSIPRDQEAYDCWLATGVSKDRISELGMAENFWQMGETGPCGPCSEIHYDMGPAASDLGHTDCKFPCDCGRYVELWNLVFMQFNLYCNVERTGGQHTKEELNEAIKKSEEEEKYISVHEYCGCLRIEPLPKPCVDTGAGLERLAAVLQGKLSNFDTDLFRPLIDEAAELANVEYGANHETDVSLRIIADHSRAATFLISDGVLPSNEGRGYVLRLIMRRALYHGQTLGLNEPFLYKMSGEVVELMKVAYPELVENTQHIAKAIKMEEERYAHTVGAGLDALDSCLVVAPSGLQWRFEHIRKHFPSADEEVRRVLFSRIPGGWKDAQGWLTSQLGNLGPRAYSLLTAGRKPPHGPAPAIPASQNVPPEGLAWIPGPALFTLHDTFGLRPDFVRDVMKSLDRRLDVDLEGYEAEMQKQRERARASWKGAEKKIASPVYRELAEKHPTTFDGYAQTESKDCRVVALLVNGQSVQQVPARTEAEMVLDHTPFYAEAGGQVGDTGRLFSDSGEEVAQVTDTQRPVTGLIVHKVKALQPLEVGMKVTAQVDTERRAAIRRNHTATHLLHAALRSTLGTHVKQAGSLVAPDRLRFDFTHYAPLEEQDRLDIEDLVNRHILANEEMHTDVMDVDAAVNSGAMALFGEKYGDKVRVVSVADGSFSKELCGGTHVRRTGDIGLFKIVSESSVAAGTRRIEAVTGLSVLDLIRQYAEERREIAEALQPGLNLSGVVQRVLGRPTLTGEIRKLVDEKKELKRRCEALEMKLAAVYLSDVFEHVREVKGVRVLSARLESLDRTAMRQMVDNLRVKMGSGVIVLGSAADGSVALIAAVSKDLTTKLDAGKIVKAAAAIVEGSGGGRKDMAEAGGKNPAKLDESLEAVPGIVQGML